MQKNIIQKNKTLAASTKAPVPLPPSFKHDAAVFCIINHCFLFELYLHFKQCLSLTQIIIYYCYTKQDINCMPYIPPFSDV